MLSDKIHIWKEIDKDSRFNRRCGLLKPCRGRKDLPCTGMRMLCNLIYSCVNEHCLPELWHSTWPTSWKHYEEKNRDESRQITQDQDESCQLSKQYIQYMYTGNITFDTLVFFLIVTGSKDRVWNKNGLVKVRIRCKFL